METHNGNRDVDSMKQRVVELAAGVCDFRGLVVAHSLGDTGAVATNPAVVTVLTVLWLGTEADESGVSVFRDATNGGGAFPPGGNTKLNWFPAIVTVASVRVAFRARLKNSMPSRESFGKRVVR